MKKMTAPEKARRKSDRRGKNDGPKKKEKKKGPLA
jgi:hypothetical protein